MAEIIRSGAPTKFTVGRVNDIYIDSISGRRYVLVSIHKIVVMNGTVTTYEWDEIGVGDSCSHTNLTTLDKLSEDPSGNLLFDGSQIKGDGSGVDGKDGADGKSAYQIAVELGFEGDEAAWLESLKGEKGETGEQGPQGIQGETGPQGEKGADGTMTFDELTEEQRESLRGPQGEKGDKGDAGEKGEQGIQGEPGRSVTKIETDIDNNVIATFSDETTETIGYVNTNIQGDFLTDGGFGNLRFYNGKFQCYDASTSAWNDVAGSYENKYILNIYPQPMKSITIMYDLTTGYFKLKLREPSDTIVDGQLLSVVEKVVLVRKQGSTPASIDDGITVLELPRSDFGRYATEYFVDTSFTPENEVLWCYKAFPVNTTGYVNDSSLNEVSASAKTGVVYGFRIDQNESDPASMITYLEDCDNANYQSAYMDFTTGVFNYGDWDNAWFIYGLKPCMLNYDGTVAYELDPNDYSLKKDGTPSDIADSTFGGNAMVGIPKVYWKIVDNGDGTADVYISNKQMDSGYHCWSHIDSKGNEIDYCYMAIYNTSFIDSVGRSLAGTTVRSWGGYTNEEKFNYASANNTTDDVIWYAETFADYTLLELLIMLIGKSTHTQKTFGYGMITGSSSSVAGKTSGASNANGLFWGVDSYSTYGVKAFGMEHLWGGEQYILSGIVILEGGAVKIKMTYGQSDGSSVDGYNTSGDGYMTVIDSLSSMITSNGYIKSMAFSEYGLIPTASGASSATYYCDYVTVSSSLTEPRPIAFGQHHWDSGTTNNPYAGIFRMNGGGYCWTDKESKYNVRLTCKPLAPTT